MQHLMNGSSIVHPLIIYILVTLLSSITKLTFLTIKVGMKLSLLLKYDIIFFFSIAEITVYTKYYVSVPDQTSAYEACDWLLAAKHIAVTF